MATDDQAQALGFALPKGSEEIRFGDDAIRQNARAAAELFLNTTTGMGRAIEAATRAETAATTAQAVTGITADGPAATPSLRTLGTGATQAAKGDHTHPEDGPVTVPSLRTLGNTSYQAAPGNHGHGDTGWQLLPLTAGIVPTAAYPCRYRVRYGVTYVQLFLQNGPSGALATLPPEARPAHNFRQLAPFFVGTTSRLLFIGADGVIVNEQVAWTGGETMIVNMSWPVG